MIVSDPVLATGLAAGTGTASALTGSAGDALVYVSLPPGTAPAGSRAIVRRVGDAATLTTMVRDGGFDPVPVGAQAGDSIEVVIANAGGGTVVVLGLAVATRRPPIVVRTDPPRKKTDVPLNAAFVVVFSEPVAAASLTSSSVQLLRGTTAIAGAVSLLQGSAAAAVFTPDAPLEANADYRLVVTPGVRDVGGDPLPAAVTAEFSTGTTVAGPATLVTVLPDTAAVAIGSQVQVIATARDTNGTIIVGRPLTWSVDNPAVATVSATGLVTAVAQGVAHVQAHIDGLTAVATVIVSPSLAPVDSVEVAPDSATVILGGLVQLTTVLRDAAGNIVRFRTVAWQSSNPAVASVSGAVGGTAVVLGLAPGTATITATSEGSRGTATIRLGTIGPYAQISAGAVHTCAVTTGGEALCWGGGAGNSGALGNGTGLPTLVPAAVAGGVRFSSVSSGAESGCGLTPSGDAFCWGYNGSGEVGTGDTTYGYGSPVAVAGGRQYAAIGGADHKCALSTLGTAYCWGTNNFGETGLGIPTGPEFCWNWPCSRAPAAVVGGLTFTTLTVGGYQSCALTGVGAAYCWGRGDAGALGDSTLFDRSAPARVAGGLSFVAITAGETHTCGLTSDGTAYCWGGNDHGELGIGTTIGPRSPCQSPIDPNRGIGNCSTAPVPVLTSQRFASISAGGGHTCALTSSGSAYCWGVNQNGQLGTGTTTSATTPVAVVGGLTFASISAGGYHSCAITAVGVVYCWGFNYVGELGDGSTTDRLVPVKVAGQP